MTKKSFIDFLIDSDALQFGEFTTKSGRLSPYFINTGKFKTGEQIKKLGEFYAYTIFQQIQLGNIDKDIKFLFGPAYKGIPLVITTAVALTEYGININYCFNRKESKDHGEGGDLIGYDPEPGDKALIIEDVITAGTAVREIIPVLKNKGVNINGLIVSVDRMEKAHSNETAIQSLYSEEGIPTFPVIDIKEIVNEYDLTPDIKEKIDAYMKEYCL